MDKTKKYRARVIVECTFPILSWEDKPDIPRDIERILHEADPDQRLINKITVTGYYDIIPGDQHRHGF